LCVVVGIVGAVVVESSGSQTTAACDQRKWEMFIANYYLIYTIVSDNTIMGTGQCEVQIHNYITN
jgi:hypothetical protein